MSDLSDKILQRNSGGNDRRVHHVDDRSPEKAKPKSDLTNEILSRNIEPWNEYTYAMEQSNNQIRDWFAQHQADNGLGAYAKSRYETEKRKGTDPEQWAVQAENDFDAAGKAFGKAVNWSKAFDFIGKSNLHYLNSLTPGYAQENNVIADRESKRLQQVATDAFKKYSEAQREMEAANRYRYEGYDERPDYAQKSAEGLAAYNIQKAAADKKRESAAYRPIDVNAPYDAINWGVEAFRDDTSYKEPGKGWTEEQKRLYGYLYATDRAKADRFAENLNRELYARQRQAQQEKIEGYAVEHPFLATAANLATMPMRGADALSQALEYGVRGDIKAKDELSLTGMSKAVTGGISKDLNERYGTIDESVPVFGGKGWGDAYQLLNSILESAESVALGSGFNALPAKIADVGSLVMFFGNAMAAGTEDALDMGATGGQALASGLAQGIAEVFFEKFSVDQIIHMKNNGTLRSFIGDFFKSGVIEGSEEFATSVSNILTDAVIMGEKSQLNDMIAELMSQGVSYEDARRAAYKQAAEDLAYDAFGGAVSGAAHTGMVGGVKAAKYGITGNMSYKGDKAELTEAAKLRGDETLQKLAEEVVNKDKLKNKDVRRFDKQLREFDRSKYEGMAQERINEAGLKADPKAARAISRQLMGEKLSGKERRAARSVDAEAIRKDIRDTLSIEHSGSKFGAVSPESISDNGKIKLKSSGEDVSIKKAVYEPGEGIRFELSNGKRVTADALSYSNKNEAILYETVGQLKVSEFAANKILEGYKPGTNAAIYARGVIEAYGLGMYGISKTELKKGFSSDLSEEQRITAYELGQAQAKGDMGIVKQQLKTKKRAEGQGSKVIWNGDRNALTNRQKVSVKTLDVVADAVGTDINLFESYLKDGKRVYKNSQGKEVSAPNGWYDAKTGQIYIDLNAGNNGEGTMLFTASHELTHFIRDWNPETFKTLADFLMEQYGEKGVDPTVLIERQIEKAAATGRTIDPDTAYEEFVADSMETMLTSENVLEQVAELKKRDRSLVEKIADWFKKLVQKIKKAYKGMSPETVEGRFVAEMVTEAERLQNLWVEGLKGASENFSKAERTAISQMGKGVNVEQNAAGEMLIAENKDGSTILWSERTYNNGGKEKLIEALRLNNFSQEDIDTTIGYIEDTLDYLKTLAIDNKILSGYKELGEHLNADIITNIKTGKQVLSTLVSNGDYPLNLDLSLTCKKRVAYAKLMDRLIKDGIFDKVNYDGEAIANVNTLLRDFGFETACLGCFVESRRLQFQGWADTLTREWNEEVEKRNPGAGYFGFADDNFSVSKEEQKALAAEYKKAGKKNDQGNLNLGKGSSQTRMSRLLDKVPSLRKKLTSEDLLTAQGLTVLRSYDPSLFSIVKSRYGAASPKIVQEYNPYANEMAMLTFALASKITAKSVTGSSSYVSAAKARLKAQGIKAPTQRAKESDADFKKRKAEYEAKAQKEGMRRYLYDIGGVRIQSFSDFMISNVFDYMQIIADLAANKYPMHGYTKEASCLRLFGMTGIKWNGSLIAHVDQKFGKEYAGLMPAGSPNTITVEVDGQKFGIGFDDFERNALTLGSENESFIQSIGMKDVVALQLDPRYSANVGSITIGVSDKQIRAMLNSPLFRMVIPYHKSGMIKEYAKLVGVDNYNDYTDYQTTTPKQFFKYELNKKTGELELVETTHPKDGKGKAYKVDTSYDYNAKVQELGDAKKAAAAYIEWCGELHEQKLGGETYYISYNPMFSNSPYGYDFTQEENYYKLLEDFNVYDSLEEYISGEQVSSLQGAVEMRFPDSSNALSEEQLSEYAKNLKSTGLYTDAEVQKYVNKAKMTFKEIIKQELNVRSFYGKAQMPRWEEAVTAIESKLKERPKEGVKFSARDSEGNKLSAWQQKFFKDSKVRDENGNLRVVYHGTDNGNFHKFRSDLTGSSSDEGFYGDGFYFAYDRKYASTYGKRVIEAYLNLKNPFFFIENLFGESYDGRYFFRNLSRLFPELTKSATVEVLEKGKDEYTAIPITDAINQIEDIAEREEGGRDISSQHWIDAANLFAEKYDDVIFPDDTSYVEEHAKEFTQALKNAGYDGVIKGKGNGEAVAFYPNQIKAVSNKLPTSSSDIRYSARTDEQTINDLRAEIAKLEDNLEMPFDPETGEDFSDSDYARMENRLTKLYHELDKMTEKEGRATVKTSIDDILANLHQYRRSDLESLAEQVSDGSWDDYEELSRFELEDALRESIEEIAGDLTTLERQAPKFGYFVRPVEGIFKDNVTKFLRGDINIRYSDREDETKPVFQTYTSAATSLPQQLPALFTNKNAKFVEGGTNVDIGAGKTPKSQEFLAERGVSYYPFDPFNRSRETNLNTLNWLRDGNQADTVTCANVLNVIDTAEGRSNVILEAAKALKPDGTAYFTTYEGSTNTKGNKAGDGIARQTGDDTFQNYRKTKTYVDEIWQWFDNVERKGSLIIAKEPKQNLPRASWEITPGEAILYSARENLNEKQQKLYDYNQKQTEVGSTLKTLNGSAIKRSPKYGNIGKDIGGEIYAHKNYAKDIVPQGILETAQNILRRDYPDFKYNALKYNPKKGVVAFQEAPNFDTAREPIVGDYISVNVETGEAKKGHSNYIWHHKWIWVRNDYKGFDVAESWSWSKRWLSTLTESSDGNGIERWNRQLDRFGLPHDKTTGQIKFSARPVKEINPSPKYADKWEKGHTEDYFIANGMPVFSQVDDETRKANEEYNKMMAKRSKKGQGTQIAGTLPTYRKIFDFLEEHPEIKKNGRIIDASSGKGLGTKAGKEEYNLDIHDLEPFPGAGYKPEWDDYGKVQDMVEDGSLEQFDLVISNAVLNVVPQDRRDELVVAMAQFAKPGGQIYIHTLDQSYTNGKTAQEEIQYNDKGKKVGQLITHKAGSKQGNEVYVWGSNSVQKGFSEPELIAYVQDVLDQTMGEGYKVEGIGKAWPKSDLDNGTTVIVTKPDAAKLSERDPFGVSNRSLLANALEEAAKTDAEKNLLRKYQKDISLAEDFETRLQEIRQEKKGKKGDELRDLKIEEKQMVNRLDIIDKRLLKMEATAPLKRLLNEEKSQALERAGVKAKTKLSDVRSRDRAALREVKQTAKQNLSAQQKAFTSEQKRREKRYEKAIDDQGKRFDKAMTQREKIAEAEKTRVEKRYELEMEQQAKRYEGVIEKLEKENSKLQDRVDRGEKELETTIQKNRERLKKLKEGRDKTAMRHKVLKVVKELNDYLVNGTEKKHVLIGMQKAVAEALDAINMDTVGATERLAEKYKQLNKAKTEDERIEILDSIGKITGADSRLQNKLNKLKQAYADIINSTDPIIARSHDEVISEMIDSTIEIVGDTSIRDMSLKQLEAVYTMYRAVLTSVRKANKTFVQQRFERISDLGESTISEVETVGGQRQLELPMLSKAEKFFWNNQKPIYAFKAIGSETLSSLFENVRAGEDTWARDMNEARAFFRRMNQKYGASEWDMDKSWEFESQGKSFKLNLNQIMSLYAYSRREQALEHLNKGGIVFNEDTDVIKKVKGVPVKFRHVDANTYSISPELLNDITNKLTGQQLAFVTEMQEFLSKVMGAKGNEVSLEMYGVKLFNEENYWPLTVADQYMAKAKAPGAGERKLKNAGFTKPVKPRAGNPVVLSGFLETWADHVDEMSNYHAFVLPMEDFYRVYNYSSRGIDGDSYKAVNAAIQNAYGRGATGYIDQLLKDLNGGAVADPRENTAKQLIGKFKKAAVFASASVVIQQPSAIGRAFKVIDPKYFVGAKLDAKKHAELWEEVKQYAPVAVIKEMGYFDTDVGRSGRDFLLQNEYEGLREKAAAFVKDGDYRDEVLGKAPALADEVTWCAIWEAAKREQKAKGLSGEALKQAAAKQFTKAIVETQVYDSVLSRSANMRSKSLWMQLWTSFGAEPTTSINMIENAIIEATRGNKAEAAKAVGAVVTSIILNSLLVSLVYAARDDDDDETFLEKYTSSFVTEMLDGLNPVTYYPLLRDVWSSAQGFDIERADMSLISGVTDSLKRIVQAYDIDKDSMDNEELEEAAKTQAKAWWSLTDYVTALMGLPVKNIRRDINGGINLIKTVGADATERDTSWASLMDKLWDDVKRTMPVVGYFKPESKAEKLYDATVKGQDSYRERLEAGYSSQSRIDNDLKKGLSLSDDRVKEAAEARYNGDMSKYKKIAKEIIRDTSLEQDIVVGAINKAYNNIKERNELDKPSEPKEKKATGFFVKDDFFDASSDTERADIKKDLINTEMLNGMTREEALNKVNRDIMYAAKDKYDEDEISKAELKRMIMRYSSLDDEDASYKVEHWEFRKKNPGLDMSDSQIDTFWNKMEPVGVKLNVYQDYVIGARDCKGVDENGDGRADSGSVKAEKMLLIDSLPLTVQQKDALYFSNGWSKRTLRKDAPWHR